MSRVNELATAKVIEFLDSWDPANNWSPAKAAFVLDLIDRNFITLGVK